MLFQVKGSVALLHNVVPLIVTQKLNRPYDRVVALNRMQAGGAILTTTEAVLFDLMRSKDHPRFREVSTLLKAHNHDNVDEFGGDVNGL